MSIDNDPLVGCAAFPLHFEGETLMDRAVEELTRKFLAVEFGADFEAARNLFACSKDRLIGTDNSRTGRLGEPCLDSVTGAQIFYDPDPGFMQQIENLQNADIPFVEPRFPQFD